MATQNTIVSKNEYRVRYSDDLEELVTAQDVLNVAKTFDTLVRPIVQITRTKVGIQDIVPVAVPQVQFSVNVTPTLAADAQCIALPSSYTVDQGSIVLFEAHEATGFEFVGWYIGETLVSEELKANIQINQPVAPATVLVIEARFASI